MSPLRVGDRLVDAGGVIGGYQDRHRVEAVGADWVVARDDVDDVWLYEGNPEDLTAYRA